MGGALRGNGVLFAGTMRVGDGWGEGGGQRMEGWIPALRVGGLFAGTTEAGVGVGMGSRIRLHGGELSVGGHGEGAPPS